MKYPPYIFIMKKTFIFILLSLVLSSCFTMVKTPVYHSKTWTRATTDTIVVVNPQGQHVTLLLSDFGRTYVLTPTYYRGWKVLWSGRYISPSTYYQYYYPQRTFIKPYPTPKSSPSASVDRPSQIRSSGTTIRRTPTTNSPSRSDSKESTPVTRKRNN